MYLGTGSNYREGGLENGGVCEVLPLRKGFSHPEGAGKKVLA